MTVRRSWGGGEEEARLRLPPYRWSTERKPMDPNSACSGNTPLIFFHIDTQNDGIFFWSRRYIFQTIMFGIHVKCLRCRSKENCHSNEMEICTLGIAPTCDICSFWIMSLNFQDINSHAQFFIWSFTCSPRPVRASPMLVYKEATSHKNFHTEPSLMTPLLIFNHLNQPHHQKILLHNLKLTFVCNRLIDP